MVLYSSTFLEFWAAYPAWRRVKKATAAAAWESEQPDLETVKRALVWQTAEWAKSEPKFTPHPVSYINARRWEDEPAPHRAPESKNGAALTAWMELQRK